GTNWADYSNVPLKEFTKGIYKTLDEHQELYPTQAKLMVGYMSKNDWLFHYSTHFGIEKALQGLSRRATFETNMAEAIQDLKSDESMIESEFRPFFKDLQQFVNEKKLLI
ncbi:MAG TPA: acyl carrier protein phosphodiesterase, partial [Ignavibacteriaceae bacterium]